MHFISTRPFRCTYFGCSKQYYRKHELLTHVDKCHSFAKLKSEFFDEKETETPITISQNLENNILKGVNSFVEEH